jgi:5-oxoprolinase (ATP-hydrolysing) subunit A
MQRAIDLNCDLGESFGAYVTGQDEQILPLVSSASIACGFHAGDPLIMQRTVSLARQHGVSVGAHPGFADLQGFGRREMTLNPKEIYALVLYQIGALAGFARACGVPLRHVKPHGALYNMAARDAKLARALACAVHDFDDALVLVGLSCSELVRAGREQGLSVAQEVFADRRYEADGTLTPRSEPEAVLTSADEAAAQVLQIVQHGSVRSRTGSLAQVVADTICLHGDRPDAAVVARAVRAALDAAGIAVRPLLSTRPSA